MTRAELRRNVLLRLAETPDQGREPLFLGEALRMAADEVARRTDCYFTYYSMDINGDPTAQEEFCLPGELYKIKSAKVTHEDSSVSIFTHDRRQIVSRTWMDQHYSHWQDSPAETGDATLLIVERPKAILYPFPTYDATAGLVLYGYAVPGEAWTASAAAETDECPLPEYAHLAVELKASLIRCVQFPTKENMARIPYLTGEYNTQLGLVTRDAAHETAMASPYAGGTI